MSSTWTDSRRTKTRPSEPRGPHNRTREPAERAEAQTLPNVAQEVLEEIEELPAEVAEAAERVLEEIEDSRIGRWAVQAYVWAMHHAPQSTRGRVLLSALVFLLVLIPSAALLYFAWHTEDLAGTWFADLGYLGVFLANMASTGSLFIPVPGLTVSAQALIVSSAATLHPAAVGVLGGLGMAVGEVTAYVAGMAAAVIAREEQIKAPSWLKPVIDRVTRWVTWLMKKYGAPTIFTLSLLPNPLFEIVGWSAGATRYPFWVFMAAVAAGSTLRALGLAYIGERLIFA